MEDARVFPVLMKKHIKHKWYELKDIVRYPNHKNTVFFLSKELIDLTPTMTETSLGMLALRKNQLPPPPQTQIQWFSQAKNPTMVSDGNFTDAKGLRLA